MSDDGHTHAECIVNGRHPPCTHTHEVIVDGDEMDTFAGERIQVEWQGGNESFALTCFHFGDAPAVKRNATDKLYVEMTLVVDANFGLCMMASVVENLLDFISADVSRLWGALCSGWHVVAKGWSEQVILYGSRFEGCGDTCDFWEPDTHLQNAQEVVEA